MDPYTRIYGKGRRSAPVGGVGSPPVPSPARSDFSSSVSGASQDQPQHPQPAARAPSGMTGTVLGHVMSAAGAPVADAVVEIIGGPSHADIASMTMPSGVFELPPLLPGRYEVAARIGDRRIVQSVDVKPNQTATLDFRLF